MTPHPRRKAREADVPPDLFREYARTRDPVLRERLVLAHAGLAAYFARKFVSRGESLEDLMQVAQVGLLLAIDRYDPGLGVEFSTYAAATIVGEIKRHFRDKTWVVHVSRRLRELNNSLMRTVDLLSTRLGRSPTMAEIAQAAGIPFEEVVEALEVGRAYRPVSLDADLASADDDTMTLLDYLGGEDPELSRVEYHHTLTAALERLPERERTILRLRYYEGRSQADVARALGISQMHVSRLQRDALQRLRALMDV